MSAFTELGPAAVNSSHLADRDAVNHLLPRNGVNPMHADWKR